MLLGGVNTLTLAVPPRRPKTWVSRAPVSEDLASELVEWIEGYALCAFTFGFMSGAVARAALAEDTSAAGTEKRGLSGSTGAAN